MPPYSLVELLDQHLSPVGDADVSLLVNMPTQKDINITIGSTNSSGIAKWEMENIAGDEDLGTVKVEAKATFMNLTEKTVNSFRISPYLAPTP